MPRHQDDGGGHGQGRAHRQRHLNERDLGSYARLDRIGQGPRHGSGQGTGETACESAHSAGVEHVVDEGDHEQER
jgi:hypothetical protein